MLRPLMFHRADPWWWRLPFSFRALLVAAVALLCIGAIVVGGIALLVAAGALP